MSHSIYSAAFLAGLALLSIGMFGAIGRRSMLTTWMALCTAALGANLTLVAAAMATHNMRAIAAAIVFLLLWAALSMAAVATALATYRRRGTENLDELRELAG